MFLEECGVLWQLGLPVDDIGKACQDRVFEVEYQEDVEAYEPVLLDDWKHIRPSKLNVIFIIIHNF